MSLEGLAGYDALGVSRETLARLEVYEALLQKWNPVINLVSGSTLKDARQRHFLDSAQLLDLANENVGTWVDLGSGGGFPGAVVAILAHELRPGMRVALIESDSRKVAFLGTVSRECGVTIDIVNGRAEDATPMRADVVSARALAPLPELIGLAMPHLGDGGVCLFPKGRNFQTELDAATGLWSFHCDVMQSRVGVDSVILKIEGLRRAQ